MNKCIVFSSALALALFTTPCPNVSAAPAADDPTATAAGPVPKVKMDVNDLSWLFPAPTSPADLDGLISMGKLTSADDGSLVWPTSAFQSLLKVADSEAARVSGDDRINLPAGVRDQNVWRIAALRIDPSAPGTSPDIIAKFGSAAQIRLIVQPVTVSNGVIKVHDIAAHVLFTFFKPSVPTDRSSLPKIVPDNAKFMEILNDLLALKKISEDAGLTTTGVPLGVHPGLSQPDKAPQLRKQLAAFLSKYLSNARLTNMAIMGLPNDFEPWIFVSIQRKPDGSFFAFPSPGLTDGRSAAEMLKIIPNPRVLPVPVANNRNPITDAPFVTPPERRGVSTSVMFADNFDKDAAAAVGADAGGQPILDPEVKNGDIPDIVANPVVSHFFNTDCVSCHTETTRRAILTLAPGKFAFNPASGISGLSPDASPGQQIWNLRNFGWFQSTFVGGDPVPTATQRTANETAAVVDFVNRQFLGFGN